LAIRDPPPRDATILIVLQSSFMSASYSAVIMAHCVLWDLAFWKTITEV
jgi:hypothetical protein